ncbi:MAG TPA: response regulator, partial [Planctomycetota bacterium]|nr:response regulator [Planctomycetota bacterium]
EPEIREVLGLALSMEGYSVRLAPDRDLALKMYKQERPDAILLDWSMSGLGIEEFLREVRTENPDECIVLVTAGYRAEQKAKELGIKHYLPKPFEYVDVLSLTERCLRDGSSKKEKEDERKSTR